METKHSSKHAIDECAIINFPIVAVQGKPSTAVRTSNKSISIIPESGKGTTPPT